MTEEKNPRYEHDCKSCAYLGQYREYDLYYCPQHEFPTVIARFGKGPDYKSGMDFAVKGTIPELVEARWRALARGLIKE